MIERRPQSTISHKAAIRLPVGQESATAVRRQAYAAIAKVCPAPQPRCGGHCQKQLRDATFGAEFILGARPQFGAEECRQFFTKSSWSPTAIYARYFLG